MPVLQDVTDDAAGLGADIIGACDGAAILLSCVLACLLAVMTHRNTVVAMCCLHLCCISASLAAEVSLARWSHTLRKSQARPKLGRSSHSSQSCRFSAAPS